MISNQIDEDIKTAMKAGETDKVSTLRMAKNALKSKAIEIGRELTEEEVQTVLAKQVKQRKDAAGEFSAAGREEIAEKELTEASLIESYLPAQMSDEELVKIVSEVISETGASGMSDMGKVMSAVMAKLAGTADGSRVSALVKEKLSE